MKQIRTLILTALLLPALFFSCSSSHNKKETAHQYITKVGMVWNTTYHISYKGPEELGDSITAVLNDVGHSLNVFDSTSLVSHINSNTADTADVHLSSVITMAKTIHKQSDGAFDPTLSPAINAWGFGKNSNATPDTAHLDSIMEFVGLNKITLDNGRIRKTDPRVQMNLSAIAKGYGCDCVAAMFRRNGITDYMVEIGGEITVGGCSPRGDKWAIAVDKPIFTDSVIHSSLATITFTDAGLATSGNYRNYHEENGIRFGHTLDAHTGRPARTDVLSVTIIAPTSMEADAYATAAMAMGSVKAKAMIDSLKLPALMVLADNSVWISDPMNNYIGAVSNTK